MKRLTYLFCALVIASITAAITGAAMVLGYIYVPLVAIPVGIILVLVCRKNVTEVIEDERIQRISGKAALRTLEILFILGAIAGSVLWSFIGIGNSPAFVGQQSIDDSGMISETITMYKPGSEYTPQNAIKTISIRNKNAMNESEATAYCSFWRDDLWLYDFSGHAGFIIGICITALITCFGAFYLYYSRKYGT